MGEMANMRDDAVFEVFIQYQNLKEQICKVEALQIEQYPKENELYFDFSSLNQDFDTGLIEFRFTRFELDEKTSQTLRESGQNQVGPQYEDIRASMTNTNSMQTGPTNTQNEVYQSQTSKARPGTATNKGGKLYDSHNENLTTSQKVPDQIQESQEKKQDDAFENDFEISGNKSGPQSKEDFELQVTLKAKLDVVRLKAVFLKIEQEIPQEKAITNPDNTSREEGWGRHDVSNSTHTVTIKDSASIFNGPLESSDECDVYVG